MIAECVMCVSKFELEAKMIEKSVVRVYAQVKLGLHVLCCCGCCSFFSSFSWYVQYEQNQILNELKSVQTQRTRFLIYVYTK